MNNRLLAGQHTASVLFPLILIAAFWPVWPWIARRAVDGSGEPWELVSLATATLFLFQRRQSLSTARVPLELPIVLLLLYAAAYPYLPPVLRAGIAVSAVAAILSGIWFDKHLHPALWGLLLLSLPVIATLDFYLGYPLRVIAGTATSALLQMNGLAVFRDGTLLNWNGQLISIDAPCSGVRMLWAGLYLTFTLAAFHRLNGSETGVLCLLAIAAILLSNILRAASLFYVESGLVKIPNEWHGGIGLATFLLTALAIAGMAWHVKRGTGSSLRPVAR